MSYLICGYNLYSHSVTAEDLPDASLDDAWNFCRNPSNEPNGPWCYTTNTETEWEYCDVPLCREPGIVNVMHCKKLTLYVRIDERGSVLLSSYSDAIINPFYSGPRTPTHQNSQETLLPWTKYLF